ncbi:phage portal protein family protein [Flavobacterium psychrophilum]|uniref:phage portal protein family protein n=2 Tax=Flavobacterium psychrophilum TaxID=96345 RepID=UPI000B7C1E36|nr:DUF935 family protein [Flavobacterium psychrophilum]MCB6070904.1 DUF935 domain-containing protein [Flavobacterium psychrophilum]MCB6108187.1 DUF935 domain-containing protein [Flavobacterium psychrophilum]SNB07114.1 hypothetical protein IT2_350091 [Flavobacterium psychrophilum]
MKKEQKKPNIIINDLTLVSPDRSHKDIQTLKTNVLSAESVYFPNRVGLYDLYHDVVSMDGYLKGILEKRIKTVLNKKLKRFDANGKEDKPVTELMASNDGRNLITQILESQFWGISGVEFVIGDKFQFEPIPRKHIKPEKGLITKSQYGITEENAFKYADMPFVWVIGKKDDLGLLLACSMYAVYKRGNFGDWAQYVEIFGQPVRIMYYDAYDTQTKTELKKVLDSSGSSLAMMIPKQAEFQMLDGKSSNGDGKLQGSFKDACNSEMAICILGNTETTSSSDSSGYAQSKEHGEQQDEITASDLIFVENMLNSSFFTNILKSYGYKVDGGKFGYELELNIAKLKTRMEIDTFVSAKVPVGDDYWYQTYGIPKPENYAQLKAEMQEANKAKDDNQIDTADEVKKPGTDKKAKDKKQLLETKKQNLVDKLFKNLADFFDQAQQ